MLCLKKLENTDWPKEQNQYSEITTVYLLVYILMMMTYMY